VSQRLSRLREAESWIAWVRVGAVPFAVFQVAISHGYPSGYERAAWTITAVLAAGAAFFFVLAKVELSERDAARLNVVAMLFDAAVVGAYVLVYSFQTGTPIRQLLFLPIVEAAVRFGIAGSVIVALATAPVLVVFEWLRQRRVAPRSYHVDYVTFQVGVEVITALIVGWLVHRMHGERAVAESRAEEAERLRDELGQRVDVLEAANRCARALASSLELDEAFGTFIRELGGLVPFDRVSIMLEEGENLQVLAAAGAGMGDAFPAGTTFPRRGTLVDEVLSGGQTVFRRDLTIDTYADEHQLVAVGLRSRLVAPLLRGARPIGLVSVSRSDVDGFAPEEVELLSLLGRLAGSAVQNIRSYEAERRTVEELRRLSALRADFVSLVSHELRSPMAAVIGSARTLQSRWRELAPEQRESFLALIADETTRLASLIGDVLDTSRIEAGTFSYRFDDVDVGRLVEEAVAAASVGQDEVRVEARVQGSLPPIRADRERLHQVLLNLIDNAVKYSHAGGSVEVAAYTQNGAMRVDVRDHGPGIPNEKQGVIFEKFGRAGGGNAKPGTGLGLFIARSIAEAHGGTIELRSAPDQGATFTLALPVEPS
jgi:K+-sensing histidine kinase KdpD